MGSQIAKSLSVSFFIAAALLGLFGAVAMGTDPGSAMAQIVLGAVMLGAGLYLRQGTAEARLAGLAACGVTSLYGAYCLFTGHGYVPGTIVAIFAFARLSSAAGAFVPQQAQAAAPAAYAPQAYPGYAGYPPAPAAPLASTPDPVLPNPASPPDPRFGP
ncbi:MAG TPA: hypothetical protein VIJ54_07640 [Actinomycetes bacterium]